MISFCLGAVGDTVELSLYFHFQRCMMCEFLEFFVLVEVRKCVGSDSKMYRLVHPRSSSFCFNVKSDMTGF